MSCVVICIALGVDDILRGSRPALIYPGGQSGSFLGTAACSTPIRVVTKEVRYIHKLSLTLEHSMSISSPAALGLTITASNQI